MKTGPEIELAVILMQGRELRLRRVEQGFAMVKEARALLAAIDGHILVFEIGIAGLVFFAERFHRHDRVASPVHPGAIMPEAWVTGLNLLSVQWKS